jgi:hypothetical protein
MRLKEKQISRKLRKRGWSINEICSKFNFAKGSVSLWVRNIELTEAQKQRLSQKGLKKEVIERRRKTRLKKENDRRQIIIDKAKKDIKKISEKDLKNIGIALYWAEGAKANRGNVQFSNSDPKMIKIMMIFFKKICKIPKEKLRGRIHIHSHLDAKKAEKYWSSISCIPLNQFYKTYCKPSISSKHKKDSLPFGTFDITICNTELFLKIKGWIEAMSDNIINMPW